MLFLITSALFAMGLLAPSLHAADLINFPLLPHQTEKLWSIDYFKLTTSADAITDAMVESFLENAVHARSIAFAKASKVDFFKKNQSACLVSDETLQSLVKESQSNNPATFHSELTATHYIRLFFELDLYKTELANADFTHRKRAIYISWFFANIVLWHLQHNPTYSLIKHHPEQKKVKYDLKRRIKTFKKQGGV